MSCGQNFRLKGRAARFGAKVGALGPRVHIVYLFSDILHHGSKRELQAGLTAVKAQLPALLTKALAFFYKKFRRPIIS